MNDLENRQWKVCVQCVTFNHAQFITETLNGFTKQVTSFPFVCAIVDDASTDGAQVIIKKYLLDYFDLSDNALIRKETEDYELTFAQHKKNKNCFFCVFLLKYNHYSIKKSKRGYIEERLKYATYIALCEGDDFWVDQYKIQKQVDFLDKHHEYGSCYTDYHSVDGDGNIIEDDKRHLLMKRHFVSGDLFSEHLKYNFIQTCTFLYRSTLLDTKYFDINSFDYTYFSFLAGQARMYYIDDDTSCYRIHSFSLTHNINNKTFSLAILFDKTTFLIIDLYLKGYFPKRKKIEHYHILLLIVYNLIGRRRKRLYKSQIKRIYNEYPSLRLYIPFAYIKKCFVLLGF